MTLTPAIVEADQNKMGPVPTPFPLVNGGMSRRKAGRVAHDSPSANSAWVWMAACRACRRCLLARIHSPAATLAVRKSSLINARICQNHLRSVAVSRSTMSLTWPSFSFSPARGSLPPLMQVYRAHSKEGYEPKDEIEGPRLFDQAVKPAQSALNQSAVLRGSVRLRIHSLVA
jgi:hypothetical protein